MLATITTEQAGVVRHTATTTRTSASVSSSDVDAASTIGEMMSIDAAFFAGRTCFEMASHHQSPVANAERFRQTVAPPRITTVSLPDFMLRPFGCY
jgi:hypothetical protein